MYDISRRQKIEQVMHETGASADDAREYLEAEEWIVYEAVYSYKADKGLLGRF
jgi:hypothetical protein